MKELAKELSFSVAGRRAHPLAVVTLGSLAVFLVSVLALVFSGLSYKSLTAQTFVTVLKTPEVQAAMRLSVLTSLTTLGLVILFCIPVGYALSRYRFPGHSLANTIVDLPIVMPPVVIGVTLLVFFASPTGRWIQDFGFNPSSFAGIVLCQFFISVSYAVRASKAAFDDVDQKLENLALTLGCTHVQAFRRVALPLARNGLVAGAVMAWSRAMGVFAPMMVFVGTTRMRVEVLPTTVYLELSIGRIEVSLAVAMIMLLMAGLSLVVVHKLTAGRAWRGV